MDQHDPASPPPAELPAAAPSTALATQQQSPDDYDWVPVRRRPRDDGWSIERQRGFIGALADCGSVSAAAREVGMSASTAYRLRRSPGGQAFAAAWDAAIQQAALHLVDIAFDRAIHGSEEPVFDKEGRRVGRRMRQNDRLLMFLLRAHLPERYAHAHRTDGRAATAAVPQVAPIAGAIAALSPPVPDDPARLMAPDALTEALDLADRYEGALPPRFRDRDGPADLADVDDVSPLGADFEAELAAAKAAAAAPGELPDSYYDNDDDDDMEDADDPDDADAFLV